MTITGMPCAAVSFTQSIRRLAVSTPASPSCQRVETGQPSLLQKGPNDLKHWDGIPYLFRITCRATTESSPFYLNLVVIEKRDNEVVDGRKMIKGTACISYKGLDKLIKLFPECKNAVKKLVCRDLLQAVIDRQAKSDVHSVYSPFEK